MMRTVRTEIIKRFTVSLRVAKIGILYRRSGKTWKSPGVLLLAGKSNCNEFSNTACKLHDAWTIYSVHWSLTTNIEAGCPTHEKWMTPEPLTNKVYPERNSIAISTNGGLRVTIEHTSFWVVICVPMTAFWQRNSFECWDDKRKLSLKCKLIFCTKKYSQEFCLCAWGST